MKKPDMSQITSSVASVQYTSLTDPGLILSVNLLSQLSILPFEFLEKKKIANKESYKAFTAAIQQNHIALLKKHDSVVVADIAEIQQDRNRLVCRKEIIHCRMPIGRKRELWKWNFDTAGYYKHGLTTSMEVVAIYV